ncbi:MAG: transcriptional regulator [Acidobacteria bacterium]|nr:transcriptional regulator [Acidobacteriota bacterium]
MDVGRLHRVLRLVTLLKGHQPYNAAQLAGECGVSRRTIHRDLNTLEQAGIPLYYDRATGRYEIHENGLLPAINLDMDEALAIILVASELGASGGLPLLQPARDAAAKLEASLPVAMRAALGGIAQRMAIRTAPAARHTALQDTFRLVQRAIVRQQPLEGVYISFHDSGQIRTRVDPYWLLFNERAWYVIGRSSRHRAVRTFKLGRFKRLEAAAGRFEMPRGLTLEKHLGNAWRMMRGDTAYEVHLKFTPKVSPNVAEVVWHKTQKVCWDDDDSAHLTVTVDGLDEIVWWVLGYGPEVEVLAPPELRRRLAAMARQMLAMYEKA